MTLDLRILDKDNEEVLFDTRILKKLNIEQLQVVVQQASWELQKRIKVA